MIRSTRNRVVLAVFLLFAGVGLFLISRPLQLKAMLWHLWNGDTARIIGYDVPVPSGWIADQRSKDAVGLVKIGDGRSEETLFPTILILKGIPPPDMNVLVSFREQYFELHNVQVFERRTVEVANESIDCVTSNEFVATGRENGFVYPDTMLSIKCESATGLSISFEGDKKYADELFSIVSQMRKLP